MAPRRGGGGGGSSFGDTGACNNNSPYPCTSELSSMYGNRIGSYFSDGELQGQIAMSVLWAVFIIVLLLLSLIRGRPRRGILALYLASLAFLISFILLAVRYGIVSADWDVPIGYRFESSVVVLLQRAGLSLLFLAVSLQLHPANLVTRVGLGLGVAVYAVLSVVYVVFDFIVSSEGLAGFQDNERWRVGDRDFAMTMDGAMIKQAKTNAFGGGLNPVVIEESIFDDEATDYLRDRDRQIKIGLAADVIAFILALTLLVLVAVTWFRRRKIGFEGPRNLWLLAAATGLLVTTLFRLIVVAHFVYWNWAVVTDFEPWGRFFLSYPETTSVRDEIVPPDGFLQGYRITADGFPIAQAVIEPFGVVLAIAGVVLAATVEMRERRHQGVAAYAQGQPKA